MHSRSAVLSMALLFFAATGVLGYGEGDALQLQTYVVESASDRPDVSDGLIATGITGGAER